MKVKGACKNKDPKLPPAHLRGLKNAPWRAEPTSLSGLAPVAKLAKPTPASLPSLWDFSRSQGTDRAARLAADPRLPFVATAEGRPSSLGGGGRAAEGTSPQGGAATREASGFAGQEPGGCGQSAPGGVSGRPEPDSPSDLAPSNFPSPAGRETAGRWTLQIARLPPELSQVLKTDGEGLILPPSNAGRGQP